MGIRTTRALQLKLDTGFGAGAARIFCDEFADWRRMGVHILFGKDAPYRKPKVAGDKDLMHVHLMPSVSKGDNDVWVKKWALSRPASHRTSDHVLVYTEDDSGNFLLIAILDEPGAHAVADMRTPANQALMESFAAIAEAFRHHGAVIA
jgi:hypothetical protein